MVLDGEGRPVCTEMLAGNTADMTVLPPVVDRLRDRFGIGRVCVVADRGTISAGSNWLSRAARSTGRYGFARLTRNWRSAGWMLDYPDIVRDPLALLRDIYGRFGWSLEETAMKSMPSWQLKQAGKRRAEFRHRYDLQDFGLTPEIVETHSPPARTSSLPSAFGDRACSRTASPPSTPKRSCRASRANRAVSDGCTTPKCFVRSIRGDGSAAGRAVSAGPAGVGPSRTRRRERPGAQTFPRGHFRIPAGQTGRDAENGAHMENGAHILSVSYSETGKQG